MDTNDAPPVFTVLIDSNWHFMDEDERYTYTTHTTYDEAVAVCKSLVDRELLSFASLRRTRSLPTRSNNTFSTWVCRRSDLPPSSRHGGSMSGRPRHLRSPNC